MAKNKSKKPSASSSAAPPDAAFGGPPLFIDRCAWSRRLGDALREQRIPFIAHHEKFAPACPDAEWLEVAGREGWIVITRDQAIRRKANELKAFREHRVVAFALASGNASAEDTARLLVELYPKIRRKAAAVKRPAMFSVTLGRTITQVRE